MLLFGLVIKRFIWRNTLHSLLITLLILETGNYWQLGLPQMSGIIGWKEQNVRL